MCGKIVFVKSTQQDSRFIISCLAKHWNDIMQNRSGEIA